MTTIERAKTDTIKWVNGEPYWSSDNTPMSIEDIKITIETIKGEDLIRRAVDDMNVDSLEQIRRDSIATILNNSSHDVENMTRKELVGLVNLQNTVFGIDTVLHEKAPEVKQGFKGLDGGASRQEIDSLLQNIYDNAVDNVYVAQPLWTENLVTGIQEGLGTFNRPWIDDPIYKDKSDRSKGFKRDVGRAFNTLGLGHSAGQDVAEGAINLSNFLDWLPRHANDRIQELFYNKLLGATEWQGGFGKKEKADETVPMEVLGMDFEMDPNSLLYKFFTLDE